jgi:hypothetical protein
MRTSELLDPLALSSADLGAINGRNRTKKPIKPRITRSANPPAQAPNVHVSASGKQTTIPSKQRAYHIQRPFVVVPMSGATPDPTS